MMLGIGRLILQILIKVKIGSNVNAMIKIKYIGKGIRISLVIALLQIFLAPSYSQDYLYQDITSFDRDLANLEVTLFPSNKLEDSRVAFHNCITADDSLILYMRRNQPDVDSVIYKLKNISFKKNFANINPLKILQNRQIYYFQKEWEPAFRQSKENRCEFFENQLQILSALEICIRSLKSGEEHKSPKEYFEFVKEINKANALKMISLHYHDPYITDKMLKLDSASTQEVLNITEKEMEGFDNILNFGKHKYMLQLESERFSRPNRDLSISKATQIEWDFYTPYLNEIIEYLRKFQVEGNALPNHQSLDYFIHSSMSFQTIIKPNINVLLNK